MENFLYEYEKLFLLNDDYTISPVINPRLTIGADIQPKNKEKRQSWINVESDGKLAEAQALERDEINLCLINREYE